ncbi:hypothetical protein LTR28_006825 [Elasticomyces elasticus]|nr:hypothetical protein LTR28_006825 [Elasticomyces elasticus]
MPKTFNLNVDTTLPFASDNSSCRSTSMSGNRFSRSAFSGRRRLALAELGKKGYIEAFNNEKKKRKGRKPFTEELRAEEGSGAMFFSPSKVKKARDLQDAKEAAKEQETQDKLLNAQDRAAQKAHKELKPQQKRKDRTARAVARTAEEALKKVQKDKQKEAKKAQKQLKTESRALNRRPRGRPARQKGVK